MYKFIPTAQKPRWFFQETQDIATNLLNKKALRRKIGELKARPRYERWYEKAFIRYQEANDKKDAPTIKKELFHLYNFWGVFPYQYFMYDMYLKSSDFSLEQMEDFIPEHVAYYWLYPKLNGYDNKKYTNKKYLAQKFNQLDIKTPKVIFYFENNTFFNAEMLEISEEEAYNLLPEENEVISKPYDGAGGKNIQFFEKANLEPSQLRKLFQEDTLVQQKITNSDEIKAIHPESLNTYRVISSRFDNKPEILFGFLRVGCGCNKVDNVHQGGLFVGIDVEKGTLLPVGYNNKQEKYYAHPDTNIVFDNYNVPAWKDVKDFVIEATKRFNHFKIIGWDIAITPEGPMAIEINSLPDVSFMHTCYGGIRKKYNIDPKSL